MSETMEKWELQELVDEAVATGQIRPEMVNQYVYSFKQGGRDIEDLTADAYDEFALTNGITTLSSDVKEYHDDKGVLMAVRTTVIVGIPQHEIPKEEWQTRHGTSYEPSRDSRGFDRFCFAKSMTKARRNGIKQFMSGLARLEIIKKLKELPMTAGAKQNALRAPLEYPEQNAKDILDAEAKTPADMLPKSEADKAADAKAAVKERPDGESEVETLRKRCFALYREHNSEVDNPKIKTGDGRLPVEFWDNVKKKFGIKSRETMELRHWRECLQMIFDCLRKADEAKKKEAEAKAEAESDVGIGDIGASDTDIEMRGQAKTDEAEGESNWARDMREARESETE